MLSSTLKATQDATVTMDLDEATFVASGYDADGQAVLLLYDAVVDRGEGPTRSVVMACGRLAPMVEALANQGLAPFRATARWDGTCWDLSSIPKPMDTMKESAPR
jgi:hypothetical protein